MSKETEAVNTYSSGPNFEGSGRGLSSNDTSSTLFRTKATVEMISKQCA
jgi:hypothetical protein